MCADFAGPTASDLLFVSAAANPFDEHPELTPRSEPLAKNVRKRPSRKNASPGSKTPARAAHASGSPAKPKSPAPAGAGQLEFEEGRAETEAPEVADPIDAFEDDEAEAESIDAAAEESLADEEIEETAGGSSVCIDDPVRMYLMQMGEIPLLSRAEELTAAQRDRAQTRTPFPPSYAGQRFRAARGRQAAGKGSRRRAAARSHDRSFGDQHRGEEADPQAARPEPGDARQAAAREPARLPLRDPSSRTRWRPRLAAWRRLARRATARCGWSKN